MLLPLTPLCMVNVTPLVGWSAHWLQISQPGPPLQPPLKPTQWFRGLPAKKVNFNDTPSQLSINNPGFNEHGLLQTHSSYSTYMKSVSEAWECN